MYKYMSYHPCETSASRTNTRSSIPRSFDLHAASGGWEWRQNWLFSKKWWSVNGSNRLYVPNDEVLKREILEEAHESVFAMHPGSTKMYHTLREHYWWPFMKKEIAEYVRRCLICQQVKAERQKPSGLLQPLPIPEWKWERITMDFVFKLPRT